MSIKRTVARNVVWNWAGMASHIIAGFIVFPFLVHQLGKTGYGLWVLIASLTGYFDLLDLGLRGAIGRNIAFQKAKHDQEGVNSIFNTGLALLLSGSGLVLLATVGALYLFFSLFEVPIALTGEVRIALILIGVNLAIIFPITALEGVLWAHQRFDMTNGIDIPAVILRTILTFLLIDGTDGSLITLALIVLGVTLFRGVCLSICSFRVDANLKIRPRYVRKQAAKQLFDFGIWCFLMSLANVASVQLGPLLIGNRFGPKKVVPFNAASRLIGYVKSIMITGTGVLTPLATKFHAEGENQKQRWLFLWGGKACMALGLFFLGGFFFLGDPFFYLWMRPTPGDPDGLPFDTTLLIILVLGELLPLSQWVTYSTVIGMSRHKLWACMSLLELLLVITLAAIFLPLYPSILTVGIILAIPAAICRGLVQMIYGCRLMEVSFSQYLFKSLLPPLWVAILPAVILGLVVNHHTPKSWLELIGFGSLYAFCYGVLTIFFLVGLDQTKSVVHAFLKRGRTEEELEPEECQEPPVEVTAP